MDDRVVDYFVVAGLPSESPQLVDEEGLCEGLSPNQKDIEPITDITVIFPSLGELVPKGFQCVEQTPSGYPANLNSGSLRSPEVYLCYRRGRDKPPLVDIGVMYDGKERLLPDAEVVLSTPEGKPANVNNTSARILLTFRRAPENMPCSELVVTDVCVIFQNKGEKPPHAFCMIPKNLNKGMMGCDVFLCYKKSMNRPPLLSFKPEVLLRYPPIDRRGFPFPPLTATFCLPMCATVECWPKKSLQPRPVFSTFVLTVADATEKIYGAAITFYETYPEQDSLNEEQRQILGFSSATDISEKTLHVNKSICILSHHPFFDAFKTFLYYLNWMTRNGPHEVPIERYISHILDEVPFPSPQRPHILMQLSSTQNILLSHPHDSPLPKSGASFRAMLNNLGAENCLMVILLVLTEQKLLIHSLRPDVLTAISEAISVLIFPFRWQCPYIPLCPLGLCGIIQAPVPFIVGVDSRFFDLYEPPTDVTCIDLDTNTITVSEDKKFLLSSKILPKKPARVLKSSLENIKMISDRLLMTRAEKGKNSTTEAMEIDFQQKRRDRVIEMEIQESFLRFTTSILKGYRHFLLPITKAPTIGATDASSLFDFQGFLRSRDKTYQKFYQLMLRTQMFIRFIEERSFVSENDSSLEFFDECVDKMDADETETVKLLETNEGNQSERTVFVMPPEPVGLPEDTMYTYNNQFVLREGLFAPLKLNSHPINRVIQLAEEGSPGSPVAKRTKQEIKSAHKVAKKYSEKPVLWAKFLLSTCYSLWFIHLPSYVSVTPSKHMTLLMAYEMLCRMANSKLHPDEVCFRVVMQLCGLHAQPMIAVKVLLKMRRMNMTPNAITYGYYNKAVLEAEWPSNVANSSQLMWNKLRNVIIGVAHFRSATKHRSSGIDTVDESDRISTGSGVSLDSQAQGQRPNRPAGHVRTQSSSAMLSPPGVPSKDAGHINGKSQSDSEANTSAAIPTRISSSSDIGYGSMLDQKSSEDIPSATSSETPLQDRQAKMTKFWGRMGQSLDQWVKSGVSSLASLAAETSYYSQSGLLMGPAYGDFGASFLPRDVGQYEDEDEEDDDLDEPVSIIKGNKSRKRLDFGAEGEQEEKPESQTLRLLRSVSFGNDTQIMSKLKLIRDDFMSERKSTVSSSPEQPGSETRRSASVESSSSMGLEAKVNQYYENDSTPKSESRDASVEKSVSVSREVTPEDSDETYQQTITPGDSSGLLQPNPPRSPSIHIRAQELSREATPAGSPARTPVTQDDPLGALSEPCSPEKHKDPGPAKSANFIQPQNRDSPKRTCSESQIRSMVEKEKIVQPCMGPPEAPPPKGFHRSSTLPNYGSAMIGDRMGSSTSMNSAPSDEKLVGCGGAGAVGSVGPTGLTAFSSNLKNPFGRYSPGRLSLRKAGSSFIESTIGGKKAEAIMEGFNQFKSAATVTVKSKLEELKEAVNANSTPGKSGPFGRYETREEEETDEFDPEPQSDQWACVSESYLDQLLTTEPGSTRASFASVDFGGRGVLHDSPISGSRSSLMFSDHLKFPGVVGGHGTTASKSCLPLPTALDINMTTCSVCHNCSSLLFDEEIMAGWTAEDSNLNTRCPHCKKWEVPFLEVTVIDYRHNPMPVINYPITSAPSMESVAASRRTSVIAPSSSNSVAADSDKKDEVAKTTQAPITSNLPPLDILATSAVDGTCSSKAAEQTPPPSELDPLGVLEEIHRSRRTSPETEAVPALPSSSETKPPNPTISVSETNPNPTLEEGVSNSNLPEITIPKLEGVSSDPVIVPYLSPLVLRKELENVLDHEGDSCLVQAKFVDEHPIIYWNLVWFFHRASLPSHIKGLSLHAQSILPSGKLVKRKVVEEEEKGDGSEKEETEPFKIHPSWEEVTYRSVSVNCLWDSPKYHEQYTSPLYLDWMKMKELERKEKTGEADTEVLQLDNNVAKLVNNLIRSVQNGTLAQTCPQLLHHYHKQPSPRHYPTYRDILFLSLISGKDSAEHDGFGFDKEYRDVYSKLRSNDDYESMDVGDTPPSDAAVYCRGYFRELLLPCGK